MKFETKQILITVKAYPNPSRKYVETVCTAGVDLTANKWIRLYPVPFRDLELKKKFKKYDVIRVDVTKSSNDHRPESYKLNCDSIQVVRSIDTAEGWKKRKEAILPLAVKSMCAVERLSEMQGVSLGLFRPKRNVEFSWESVSAKLKPGAEDRYAQLTLFSPQKEVLEKVPYIFRYRYFCDNEPECKGHHQCIIDWEIGESYRSWKVRYKTEEKTLEMIKQMWQDQMFAEDRDTHLFVGNQHQFKTFMILGVFWPPKG